jgi:long-subunit fatty acid transport protein
MSSRLIRFGLIVLVLGLASPLYAGGIINKQNLSADYIRTLNRNAATDLADAAVYNPAGTAMMKDGLYIKADAMYLSKSYANQMPSTPSSVNLGRLEAKDPSIIPGLFAVYKQDRWSTFFTVTIPGGGGKVKYENGDSLTAVLASPSNAALPGYIGYLGLGSTLGPALTSNATTIKQQIEAESVYLGYSVGASYKVTDTLSLAGGIRYVDASQKFKGSAQGATGSLEVNIERTDTAFNYFLGLDYAPSRDLTIALTYMSNTPLDFKAKTTDTSFQKKVSIGVGWTDGTQEREDLPGYIGLGVSYFVIPGKLRIEPNFTYYLEKQATLNGQRYADSNPGNSFDIGITTEYILNPQWRFSVGYLRTEIKGMKTTSLLPEAPELSANSVALGFVWDPTERLSLTLGGTRNWYNSETTETVSMRAPAGTKYEKDVWGVAFGAQYRFF